MLLVGLTPLWYSAQGPEAKKGCNCMGNHNQISFYQIHSRVWKNIPKAFHNTKTKWLALKK